MVLPSLDRPLQRGLCGLLALCAQAAAIADEPAPAASVVAHADHYVVGGRGFSDVDAVAAALPSSLTRPVRIDACMPGAGRALTAVVHRLRERPLHLRVLQAGDAACVAPLAMPVSARGAALSSADDATLERVWTNMMP